MKTVYQVVIFTLLIILTSPQSIYAQEISGQKRAVDVFYVIDSSGSMKSNDSNRMALDMVKAFINTVHTENIRVGYMTYNNKIVSSSSPVSIAETSERERVMVLVSDGESDLALAGSKTGRTLAQSDQDVSNIVETCQAGVKVFSQRFKGKLKYSYSICICNG